MLRTANRFAANGLRNFAISGGSHRMIVDCDTGADRSMQKLAGAGADMTHEQAIAWMRQVDARVYRAPRPNDKPDSWVAIVRVPAIGFRRHQLIVALGETLEEAARVAEQQWQTLWGDASTVH